MGQALPSRPSHSRPRPQRHVAGGRGERRGAAHLGRLPCRGAAVGSVAGDGPSEGGAARVAAARVGW
eukprot:5252874-Prymnesium_polylepis.1